jgi:beta-galactosidase
MAEWSVPFESGALKALGFREGKPVARCEFATTGEPVSLGLELHSSFNASSIPADDQFALPITVFAADAQGRRVPTARDFVTFELAGPGRILGVGNGDPTCHEPDKASSRSLFNGLAQVIVQATSTPGTIKLRASASGLHSAELQLTSTLPAAARCVLPAAPQRYLITDWRMSPITPQRPDPNQTVAEQDMNSWQRIDPSQGPQKAWEGKSGFAIYRATFTPPKAMQSTGGRVVMSGVIGLSEVWLNGSRVARINDRGRGHIEFAFPAAGEKQALSILIRSHRAPAGIAQDVELLS